MEFFEMKVDKDLNAAMRGILARGNSGAKPNGSWGCNNSNRDSAAQASGSWLARLLNF